MEKCSRFECAFYKTVENHHYCRAEHRIIYGGSCVYCRRTCSLCRYRNKERYIGSPGACEYEPFSEPNGWKKWRTESARQFYEEQKKRRMEN